MSQAAHYALATRGVPKSLDEVEEGATDATDGETDTEVFEDSAWAGRAMIGNLRTTHILFY